jgi:transposase InsO family protein
MPWKVTEPMTERARFVALHDEGLFSMTELCQRFNISRRTGYKWLARFEQGGLDGLKDQSRKPHSSPKQTSLEVQEALLQARRDHPSWGPKKLLAYLWPRRPDLPLPAAASTVGELLKQQGLSQPRKRPARSWKHPGQIPLLADAANQTWCADFKGQFPTKDGKDCYPLTITDAHSRFILCCHGLPSVRQEGAFPVFERAFAQFGLPGAIRTDNGVPFATQAICGLSKLSVWWTKLGIAHQRIEPGQPQQNGRHERMHKTLKRETARPPEADHEAQQARFDTWRAEFNQERPHEALEMKTPASLYVPSPRPLPSQLPEPCYPGHFQVRLVSKSSMFRLHHRPIFISEALVDEYIGLEETGDGIWSVYFYDVLLGRLSERDYKVRG